MVADALLTFPGASSLPMTTDTASSQAVVTATATTPASDWSKSSASQLDSEVMKPDHEEDGLTFQYDWFSQPPISDEAPPPVDETSQSTVSESSDGGSMSGE